MEPMEAGSTVEQMLLERAKQRHTPINGSIELLPLCNMNCDMCYVRLSRTEMEKIGKLRTAEEWIQIGQQMVQAGVLFLLLTGGEPLLFPDFRRLYLEFKKMGMILTINTNGTLIDEEWADFFGKHKPRRVNITLYGMNDAAYETLCHYPGGYTKTIRGIRLLKEHGVDVKIAGSVTKSNLRDMEHIQKNGRELDIPVRMDTYMLPGVRERSRPFDDQVRLTPEQAALANMQALKAEMEPEIFKQYVLQTILRVEQGSHNPGRRVTCMAGNCSFTINWQGEMRPCVMLTEPAVSVFEAAFEEAWKEIVSETEKILLNEKCGSCSLRPICRTCAASALLETGDYEGIPDYMCKYSEESLRLLYMEREGWNDGTV